MYTVGIVLSALATAVPLVFVVMGRDPYLLYHLALNIPVLVLCAAAVVLLRVGKVTFVENMLLGAVLLYILAWDVVNLVIERLPSSSEVVSNAPVFLLGCIMLCLILPFDSQRTSLLAFTAAHLGLTWANMLRFDWGPVQVSQLTTDVITVVAVLLLGLIGLYQLQLVSAEARVSDLSEQVNTDPLTGLLNRRAMYPVLEGAEPMAVALIDLDDFKAVNDTYGHMHGDGELVAVAGALAALADDRGLVARWGGEEFLVVLRGFDLTSACEWAERARCQVEGLSASTTTLSIGLTTSRPNETVARLLSRADDLLYEAKRRGKNQVVSDANPPTPLTADS